MITKNGKGPSTYVLLGLLKYTNLQVRSISRLKVRYLSTNMKHNRKRETTILTYKNDNYTGNAEGPWTDEPDKAQWVDPGTDLDCLIVRNKLGALCGYVGVPSSHPWHGDDYDSHYLDVHGGLTFAGGCQENTPVESGICHVPQDGRPDDVWWFGFDTAHLGDLVPSMVSMFKTPRNETYKNFDYVKSEVERLAAQLAEA